MKGTTTLSGPHMSLLDWLAGNDVEVEIHEHAEAFTARASARAEGVDPRTFAKVVGVMTEDGRRILVVLDATDHLDLSKAAAALFTDRVRLLSEGELTDLARGCEAGALPAVGRLYGLPTYADHAVRDDPDISFNAGSHRFSVRVDREAWEKAARVRYADLALDSERRPAWDRS
ncbi:MAG TPA: YbaK/EbsC family protein [Candidatus Limnocylindrales bacterium]|nr:YbaK/EbsC family protein [Candidatus Limnocylindrales bacterium]